MCRKLVLLFSLFICVSSNGCGDDITWAPDWMPHRNDLCCGWRCENPEYSLDIPVDKLDQCCGCYTYTIWDDKEEWMDLEYVSVTGKSLVLSTPSFDSDSYYGIEHTFGEMTDIPSNICDWENDERIKGVYVKQMNDIVPYWERIVTINFSYNRIKRLLDLTCLVHLDTLKLTYNNIVHLSNTSIANLSFLRELDLSHNNLQTLDPKIVASSSMFLFRTDFSHNDLEVADITNIFSLYPFCSNDLTWNRITYVVNELEFHLNISKQYGPGFVRFNHNLIRTFPDFKTLLGLEHLLQIGTLYGFGFDFRDIQLECDCHIAPFLNMSRGIQAVIWREYFNVKCVEPDDLRDMFITSVDLNQLVCVLEVDSYCPIGCKCVDRPNTNTLHVDCRYLGLTAMPDTLPLSNYTRYISLDLSHNKITTISNASYLVRLSILNVSYNNLNVLTKEVAADLENVTLDLKNNFHLRSLPRTMHYRKSCRGTLMKNVYLQCDCENIWLEQWIGMLSTCPDAHTDILFTCDVPSISEYVNATEFTKTMLICDDRPDYLALITMLGIVIFALAIGGFLAARFKYEILIMYLKFRNKVLNKLSGVHFDNLNYDLAITFYEEDDNLRKWVMQHLVGALETEGYKVFIPFRDIAYGSERDGEIVNIFGKTKSFVLVLSESYLAERDSEIAACRSWTENEWKYAWHQYRKDRRKDIVIVNYDHIPPSTVDHAQISAFLRVGDTIEFDNHDATIMDIVFQNLGKPIESNSGPKGHDNKARKFVQKRQNYVIPANGIVHHVASKIHHYDGESHDQTSGTKSHIWTSGKVYPDNEICDSKEIRDVDLDELFVMPSIVEKKTNGYFIS